MNQNESVITIFLVFFITSFILNYFFLKFIFNLLSKIKKFLFNRKITKNNRRVSQEWLKIIEEYPLWFQEF